MLQPMSGTSGRLLGIMLGETGRPRSVVGKLYQDNDHVVAIRRACLRLWSSDAFLWHRA